MRRADATVRDVHGVCPLNPMLTRDDIAVGYVQISSKPPMEMNVKKLVLTGIVAALFAWTGIETYRYWEATNQLAASLERQKTVEVKLAQLKRVQLASKPVPVVKP